MSEHEILYERRLAALRTALGELIMSALEDPDVVEIMLNDDGKLFIEKHGKMRHVGNISPQDGEAILSLISTFMDGEYSKESPVIEGELPLDGSRFEGVGPPVTARPSLTIRKKASKVYTLDDYIRSKVLTFSQAEALRKAIIDKKNILVVGGTGSGKTTFCNALIHAIAVLCPEVRMLILEDVRELQCTLENRVFLKATEWTSMAVLATVVNRMRGDRISVGEVRSGKPALELLKLWNTGHPGGVATVHANSAYGGLTRLDQLIQEESANPQRILIGEAVDIAVYLEGKDKKRTVKEIIRVDRYDPVKQEYVYEAIL